jgi:hypothetical protein
MAIHRLSKSRFIAGLQCERRLWLLVNQSEDKRDPTLAETRRMRRGTQFGRDVMTLFPGGVEITADHEHPQDALDATAVLLDGDAPALFEAAFLHNEVLIRADIMRRSQADSNAWALIEVKSASNSANSESSRNSKLKKHISDMAVQLHVLEGAGVTVESMLLAWVNSSYLRVGDLDWDQLVAIEDHSEHVRARATTVGDEIETYLALIDRSVMPTAVYGKTKCGECEFNHVCWNDEPDDSIIHLPRINEKRLVDLSALGVRRIPDIPRGYGLSKTQAQMREAYNYPDGHLANREQLEQWIETLLYPLHFFDIETWSPCIPPFDNTWPYMQIPFQYSLHVQEDAGAELDHREFLAIPGGDPRTQFIDRMVSDLGVSGSIVVHHAEFEAQRIRELAIFSPEHSQSLMPMLNRIVDTEIPFKENWYLHPSLMGRSSIKVVLPTLVPELSYEAMAIADGLSAAFGFEDMYEGVVVGDAARVVRENLLDYCRMDTLAMARIVETLRGLLR